MKILSNFPEKASREVIEKCPKVASTPIYGFPRADGTWQKICQPQLFLETIWYENGGDFKKLLCKWTGGILQCKSFKPIGIELKNTSGFQ